MTRLSKLQAFFVSSWPPLIISQGVRAAVSAVPPLATCRCAAAYDAFDAAKPVPPAA
jgi:hypothetical protein